MEFNSSGSFTAIRINIFYSNSLRNKFNNLDKSVELIDFDNIDKLLLEEFN